MLFSHFRGRRPSIRRGRSPLGRWAAFLVGVVTLTFPPLAVPVYAGLDPSWMIGLHEALEADSSSAVTLDLRTARWATCSMRSTKGRPPRYQPSPSQGRNGLFSRGLSLALTLSTAPSK